MRDEGRPLGLGRQGQGPNHRKPVAQERVELRPDGLVRITLKKAYADGTIAVDMDPLSLLCRLATSVPPPRRHTVRYSGVLAPASPWRRGLAPMAPSETPADDQRLRRQEGAPSYRPWAELLARTCAVDVLACPKCHGQMRLLAMVGEATDMPPRSPGRGPPYWKSRVLRRQALGEEDDGQGRGVQETA
jgi:hypothetical protein